VFSFFGICIGTVFRALRFHILMKKSGSTFWASLEMILIGYFFTSILPLRTGELMRIGYFTRRTGAPLIATTTGIVVERVMDLIALALVASVVLSGLAGRHFSDLPVPVWTLSAGALFGIFGAIAIGWFFRHRIMDRKILSKGKIGSALGQVAQGLSALGSASQVLFVLSLSVGLWIVVSASMKIAFLAMNLDVPLADATVVMLGTCFMIALPSTPGFVGTYHLGFVAGALLVGIPKEIALPVGIVFHLVIQLPFLPIGGFVLFTGGRKTLVRPADTQ
jgi:uncharacterized protein (TIRG00374 family)